MDQLKAAFENNTGTSLGEELKRLNMLMQLDWLQGRSRADHFRRYLALLSANGLQQAAFIAGLNVLDTAAGRRQYIIADELLQEWVESVIASTDAEKVLGLAQAQMRKGHSWAVAQLLAEDNASGPSWAGRQFEAKTLRCLALHDIWETICEPSKKTEVARTQAAWASQSLDLNGLRSILDADLEVAERLFNGLAKANNGQKSLRKELVRIEQDLHKGASPPSSKEVIP